MRGRRLAQVLSAVLVVGGGGLGATVMNATTASAAPRTAIVTPNGAPATIAFTAGVQTGTVTVQGLAGQQLTVATAAGTFADNCGLALQLLSPTGAAVGASACAGQSGSVSSASLPADGLYKASFLSAAGASGTVAIAATSSAGPASITAGAEVLTVPITAPDQDLRFGFTAAKGDVVSVTSADGNLPDCNVTLRLVTAAGVAIGTPADLCAARVGLRRSSHHEEGHLLRAGRPQRDGRDGHARHRSRAGERSDRPDRSGRRDPPQRHAEELHAVGAGPERALHVQRPRRSARLGVAHRVDDRPRLPHDRARVRAARRVGCRQRHDVRRLRVSRHGDDRPGGSLDDPRRPAGRRDRERDAPSLQLGRPVRPHPPRQHAGHGGRHLTGTERALALLGRERRLDLGRGDQRDLPRLSRVPPLAGASGRQHPGRSREQLRRGCRARGAGARRERHVERDRRPAGHRDRYRGADGSLVRR